MYGWIWHKLPGGSVWKTLESAVLAVLVAGVLVVVVFPWVEPKLPFSGNTVSGDTDTGVTSPSPTPSPGESTTKRPSTTSVPSPTGNSDDEVIPGE